MTLCYYAYQCFENNSKILHYFTFDRALFAILSSIFHYSLERAYSIFLFFFNSLLFFSSLLSAVRVLHNSQSTLFIAYIRLSHSNRCHGGKKNPSVPFFSSKFHFSRSTRIGFMRCKSCDVFNICNLLASEHSFSLCHHTFDWWLSWWDRSLCFYTQNFVQFFFFGWLESVKIEKKNQMFNKNNMFKNDAPQQRHTHIQESNEMMFSAYDAL